jgi:predicted nucleotide-binding protein
MPFVYDYRRRDTRQENPDPLTPKAIRLLKGIYEKTGGRSRAVRDVTELETGLSPEDAKAGWRALMAHGLIEGFNVDYAARMSEKGIEFVQTVEIPAETPVEPAVPKLGRKVYIVRGSASGAHQEVMQFLEQAGCQSILLHEQAAGRSIMEQADAHSGVEFAIVLLTPADLGITVGGSGDLRPPLNVLMELGYFIGRLGRTKVCAFALDNTMVGAVDLAGVTLRSFDDSGNWKSALSSSLQG